MSIGLWDQRVAIRVLTVQDKLPLIENYKVHSYCTQLTWLE